MIANSISYVLFNDRESSAAGGRGNSGGGTSMGSSTLVPDRSSTPVATEYADDGVGEALGGDDDASETDEPSAPAPVPPTDAHHDDAMTDRYVLIAGLDVEQYFAIYHRFITQISRSVGPEDAILVGPLLGVCKWQGVHQ